MKMLEVDGGMRTMEQLFTTLEKETSLNMVIFIRGSYLSEMIIYTFTKEMDSQKNL